MQFNYSVNQSVNLYESIELKNLCSLICVTINIPKTHSLQTFRNYREMFEEQKSAIEQRYRHLLEDSIQDAVFLSARNNELTMENQELRQRKFRLHSLDGYQNNKEYGASVIYVNY